MSRLDILRKSLENKEAKFNQKLAGHFADVKRTNGQPLNDKKCGRSTFARWEKQNDALLRLDEEIEKTKEAIENEESKCRYVAKVKAGMPKAITDLIDDGTLVQWRKYPHIMFVNGVDKARIVWDEDKKKVFHKFVNTLPTGEQRKKFAAVYNKLHHEINTNEP